MNIKARKKTFILAVILVFIVQPLLMGSGLLEVRLRNTDEENRLVNIDKLIGGNYMPDPTKDPVPEELKTEESEDKTEAADDEADITTEEKETSITISISGRIITINGIPPGKDMFEGRFLGMYDGTQEVELVDNYAEYHTYRDVKDFLNNKQIIFTEKGI